MTQPTFCLWIVSPPGYRHSRCFDEVAIGLHYGLAALSIPAPIVREQKDIPGGATPIILGGHLLAAYPQAEWPQQAIVFNMEQIGPDVPWITPAYLDLLSRYEVWDYSDDNIQQLHSLGISRTRLCPIGYVPELTRIAPLPPIEEDIDVLFYGSLNPRRLLILNRLEAMNLRVVRAFGVYGEERDRLIARAKIVLNLHFYEAKVFEIVRVSYLLANQRCVVSELGADPQVEHGYANGVVFASYERLAEVCHATVHQETRRLEVAKQGFIYFSGCSQARYLGEMLARDAM